MVTSENPHVPTQWPENESGYGPIQYFPLTDSYQHSADTQQEQQPQRSGLSVGPAIGIVVAVLVLIALVIGLSVTMFMIMNRTAGGGGSIPVTVVETETVEVPASESEAGPVTRPPASAESSFGREMPQRLPLEEMWTSGPTSLEFALAVQSDVMDYYYATGLIPSTVTSYSPRTGEYYDMNCMPYYDYVHCYGGDGANVYLR